MGLPRDPGFDSLPPASRGGGGKARDRDGGYKVPAYSEGDAAAFPPSVTTGSGRRPLPEPFWNDALHLRGESDVDAQASEAESALLGLLHPDSQVKLPRYADAVAALRKVAMTSTPLSILRGDDPRVRAAASRLREGRITDVVVAAVRAHDDVAGEPFDHWATILTHGLVIVTASVSTAGFEPYHPTQFVPGLTPGDTVSGVHQDCASRMPAVLSNIAKQMSPFGTDELDRDTRQRLRNGANAWTYALMDSG